MNWAEITGYVTSYVTRAWLDREQRETWCGEAVDEIACAYATSLFDGDYTEQQVWLDAAAFLEERAEVLRSIANDWSDNNA